MSLQELIASGLVLESPEHGPQLCLGWVGMSNPPVGAGPDITNWDWSKVSDHETVEGTRWGTTRSSAPSRSDTRAGWW